MALRLRDPHESGSWGVCPFRALTGLDCPGCGGLRAVNDLTHLDLAAAASSNLLVVLVVPLAIAVWGWWLVVRWRGVPLPPSVEAASLRWGVVAMVVLVAFAVLRNLPGLEWLSSTG
ncbi:DUF2752 domain-containing protein [Nocardioides sp.]|uniref:DUF2752 domain-containing protein n=1 Tax=Nocardioides sp. TaxID=35761 RepID=UPI0027354E4F|nr:DUF2752 domain-containing protein [Nocardioides sp.]MDP3892407.1 DUF2752 domain-containing protein [Nocardioides sp.]